MKKTLRTVGAAGLAAATIVTGLSFGSADATAASVGNTDSAVGAPFQIIAHQGNYYYYVGKNSQTPWPQGYNYTTSESEARKNAEFFTPHLAAGASLQDPRWTLEFTTGNNAKGCLFAYSSSDHGLELFTTYCNENKRTTEEWTVENGNLKSAATWDPRNGNLLPPSYLNRAQASGRDGYGNAFRMTSTAPSSKQFDSVPDEIRGIGASVSGVDLNAGTATVSGPVTPDATTVLVEWTDQDEKRKQKYITVKDGNYAALLSGLSIGTTPVTVTALDGSEEIVSTTVDVELEVAPVTAAVTFDKNVNTVAQVSGTAQPNTDVKIQHGEKGIVTVHSEEDGTWSTPINAPNMPGVYNLTVGQDIRGEDNGRMPLDIDYGAGVAVTSPDNGYELEPGDPLVIRGSAPEGTEIVVHEKGTSDVLGNTKAGSSNSYLIPFADLEDREYTLVVEGITKGYNRTRAELSINPGKSAVKAPTADVVFDQDVSKKATVTGTGVDGATISIKDENGKTLGTTTVDGGTWSKQIDPIGAGKHTLTIEQTGIEGTQTVTAEADFGAAVSLNAPATFAGGKMTVTGKSSQGAQVAITTGGNQVDSFTVTNSDGSFSRDLTGLGSGKIELAATAKSKGALTTITATTSTAPITAESIQIGSHVKNGTFTPGEQLFTGRGTVGATVTLNVHGFSPATAAQDLTTTVNQFGEWSIKRGLADTTYPLFSVKQSPQAGVTNELLNWNLRPYDGIGAPGDLQLTNFKDGDFFNPGDQTFAGKATPGATIVFNPFGLDNPAVEQYDITTKADPKTGDWTIRRAFADTNYDRIGVRQEPAAEGKVNQINGIRIAPYGWVGAPADLTVTSHADGTFSPGNQTFTGTATPGTKVTLYAWGDNPTNPATAVANARGKWTINRILNTPPTTYNVKIVQEDAGAKVSTVYLPLTAKQ